MKGKKKTWRRAAIAAGVIVIAVLVLFGARSAGLNGKKKVVIAASEIKAGTVVASEDVQNMFKEKEVDTDVIPENCITDIKELAGKGICVNMPANTIVGKEFVSDNGAYISKMKKPVIAGLRAVDVAQFASGMVRAGDYVNISVIDSSTNECINVLENVYVAGAYNSDGSLITDDTGCAMVINILVEQEDEQKLNSMLELGTVRVCVIGDDCY